MPAINLSALDGAIENLRKEKANQKESQEVADLRSANKRLKSEKKDLAEQLLNQGKCMAALKKKPSASG